MRTWTRGSTALLVALLMVAAAAACSRRGGSIPTPAGGGGGTDHGGGGGADPASGRQHTRVSYGPFTVKPAAGQKMGMANEFRLNVRKPCTNCYLTGFRASLTDDAGKEINTDTGQWLHHMVLTNSGATNLTCGNLGPEPFFSAGNERTPVDLSKLGSYGYPVKATDSWGLIAELANLTTQRAVQNVTMDFDWVPLGTPGIRPARPLWLDIANCAGSNKPAKPGSYSYASTWTSNTAGKLLYAHAHMHDGATHETVTLNGRQVCDSTQTYGGDPAFVEGPDAMMPGMAHISSVGQCEGTTARPLAAFARGDRFTVTAYYDSQAHAQMGDEPVMGIVHAWFDPAA